MAAHRPGGGPTLTRILRVAGGGDGVGTLDDGRTVFVPRSAPGDLVELTALRTHARFARARIGTLEESGPDRIAPRCQHYGGDDCGGCQLQHLTYDAQLAIKRGIVEDALHRIGRLEVTVPAVVAAAEPWTYRSRITLGLAPGRRHAGLHPVDRPDRVFALARCEIAAKPLMRLWQALATSLHLLPPDAQHVVLRLDREAGMHLVVRAEGKEAWSKGKRLGEVLAAQGVGATVWWQPERGAARVMAGDREAFPATVFEQVHPGLAERIRSDALEALGPVAGLHAWDLYAGIGETSDRLFTMGATVESVELDRRAVEVAERRWRGATHERENSQRPEPEGMLRHVGRVEEVVPALRDPAVVIANPPRTGLDPAVGLALVARRPRRIVYVSCDPATLARDLARLCGTATPGAGPSPQGTYRLTAVQPYDLFPQTAHVETVAVLEA